MFAPRDMTEGSPWKNLLIFTIPMLFGNIVQQLYSTVDAIVVGQFMGNDGDNALAAIGSTMPLLFLISVLLIGISSGAGIMVSQYFGAKKREELSFSIGTCITAITVCGLFMMIIFPLGTRPLLELIRTPEGNVLDWAVDYLNILLWGALGQAFYNILTGILRGLGDSLSALLYLIIACLLNIALDLLFVAVFGWGVAGAAVATIIAQFVSGALCLWRLFQMRATFDIGVKYLRPTKAYMLPMIKLGLPTGASQAIFSLAMVLVQSLTNSFGEMFIAANVIVMRIDGFVVMPIFSFANAIMVFAGQNMGAGKIDRVRQGTKQCAFMSAGTSFVIVLGILFFGRAIAGLFTDTEEIIETSMRMLRVLAAGYIVFALGQVFWSVIRGAGDTMTPMWASLISVVAVRVPSAYLLVYLMKEPDALFYSLLVSWSFTALLSVFAYRKGTWRDKGIVRGEAGEGIDFQVEGEAK
ncbi:MAG: MATE family efflux transporter [Clostridiales bacterium]|jgi:putative MATE family efflux protein|nr:MATE family efflux transporter [Clostridiales bacterium]